MLAVNLSYLWPTMIIMTAAGRRLLPAVGLVVGIVAIVLSLLLWILIEISGWVLAI
jgi:hypothetical protein